MCGPAWCFLFFGAFFLVVLGVCCVFNALLGFRGFVRVFV